MNKSDDASLVARSQPGLCDAPLLIAPGLASVGTWEWDAITDGFSEQGFWGPFLGYRPEDIVSTSIELHAYTHPDDLAGSVAAWKACVKGEVSSYEAEHRLRDSDGRYRWVLARGRVTERDRVGRTLQMKGVYFDIERFKAVEASLAQSNAVLQAVLDAIPQMVYWKDRSSRYLGCNRKFAAYAGLSNSQSIVGKTDMELFPDKAKRLRMQDQRLLEGDEERLVVEEHVVLADGLKHWLEKIKVPLCGTDGTVIGVLATTHDLTERKRAEGEIERLAYFDPLTELPNRRYFLERLDEALGRARRHNYGGTVLFIDIDRFKNVNDRLGHTTGDHLLIQAGMRIRSLLRKEDIAARLGGDEFVVLIDSGTSNEVTRAKEARNVAEKIRVELARPFEIDGKAIHISATIGIALYSDSSNSAESVLRMADTAMYHGKVRGRDRVILFDPALLIALDERLDLETSLRSAIERKEFELYYQPQVNQFSKVLGAEAILRWKHAALGDVSPERFIPIAEQCGLINEIGQWVIDMAVAALNRWVDSGVTSIQHLAVNVSAHQFRSEGFVEDVTKILEANPNARGRLVLEITESAAVDHDDAAEKMRRLRDAGALFSIDDFGVGYSSLSYIARLPFDQIKIDRSFITGIEHGGLNAALVATLMTLGQHLDYVVIAEGVETIEALQELSQLGCHEFQGFLFSKPLPEAEFLAYCARGAQR